MDVAVGVCAGVIVILGIVCATLWHRVYRCEVEIVALYNLTRRGFEVICNGQAQEPTDDR